MGIKRRNKVSAQFSMSSLTDIIFLLLIFFMLTSTLVAPNALNLKLPGTSRQKPSTDSNLDRVNVDSRGRYFLNGSASNLQEIETALARKARRSSSRMSFIIDTDGRAPVEAVVAIMDVGLRLDADAILAAAKE
jgi:biopolymer transport protein ExbD